VRRLTSAMRHQQLEWRRSRVGELSSEGYSIIEIARRLQIDKSAVNRDIQYLRQQGQENLQHIHETIAEDHQKCTIGIKGNLKKDIGDCGDRIRSQD
jgi:predicted transcriptional regulator